MKQRPKLLITSDEKRGFDVSRIRNTPLKKRDSICNEKRGFGVSTPLKKVIQPLIKNWLTHPPKGNWALSLDVKRFQYFINRALTTSDKRHNEEAHSYYRNKTPIFSKCKTSMPSLRPQLVVQFARRRSHK
jgi:hypothetical protein